MSAKINDQADRRFDVVQMFGPLAGMHAAMDRLGVGMPCGLVARFEGRTVHEVETAINSARQRFPVLACSLAWENLRPMLVPLKSDIQYHPTPSSVCPSFTAAPDGPVWGYEAVQDGTDSWLSAVWVHASADGLSMLRFIEAVAGEIGGRQPSPLRLEPLRRKRQMPFPAWLPRFVLERHLSYVNIARKSGQTPSVAWVTIDRQTSAQILAKAHSETGGFAAWLAAAACMAYCEQATGAVKGRVSLNLPVANRDLSHTGNFGFGAGTLLIPVMLDPSQQLAAVAQRIRHRKRIMIAQGWDTNFESLLGKNPKRHMYFAKFEARKMVAPTVTVSWKGVHNGLGDADSIRDLACFAAASVAHVSSHADHNGLSVSVTSPQSPGDCEALLRNIVNRLGGGAVERVRTLANLQTPLPH